MTKILGTLTMIALFFLLPQNVLAGKGFMGGTGSITVQDLTPPAETVPTTDTTADTAEGGIPETVTGPLNDRKSSSGQLFGDLYKVLRYHGEESAKMIPETLNGVPVCKNGNAVVPCASGKQNLVSGPAPIGGEPILSAGYGMYSKEVTGSDGTVSYELAYAPYPSQCVQPVANYAKWGAIGTPSNTLPLIMLYDPTWGRTECAVGEFVSATVSSAGELVTVINEYYIQPTASCPGVKWIDMVDEVSFGRLNLSRSPEAVLQAAFDEAINAINNSDSIALDPAGRLLLTTTVYNNNVEPVDDENGCPVPPSETVVKAIDSPLENLALYVKLVKDGHLITAGDERAPLDRSENGGIPLWKMLELSDGPSSALRPTVDVNKLKPIFPDLVDAADIVNYYTFYECYTAEGSQVTCLCPITQPDGSVQTGMCPDVATRKLITATSCPTNTTCEAVPWYGITTDSAPTYSSGDFKFAAAFLAAAADKTGAISVDMVVYINSILGINKVIGYSAYDAEGNPTADAVNYSVNPIYFNFIGMAEYDRGATMTSRGQVTVLQGGGGTWTETPVDIIPTTPTTPTIIPFRNLMLGVDYLPNGNPAVKNILGFTQRADDNLGVINFIHTYQIPSGR